MGGGGLRGYIWKEGLPVGFQKCHFTVNVLAIPAGSLFQQHERYMRVGDDGYNYSVGRTFRCGRVGLDGLSQGGGLGSISHRLCFYPRFVFSRNRIICEQRGLIDDIALQALPHYVVMTKRGSFAFSCFWVLSSLFPGVHYPR